MNNLVNTIVQELKFAGVKRKQKTITNLFPTFHDRVKAVATKGGLRLVKEEPGLWHFKIHSGTKNNVWYDAYVQFTDIDQMLKRFVKNRHLWVRDKSKVDMRKLANKILYETQIKVYCSCPAFQYWGPAYILSLNKYDAKYSDKEKRPPRIRNPKRYGAVCKHLQGLLNALSFYEGTMASYLTKFYSEEIKKYEDEIKKEAAAFKVVGKELGVRKKKKESEGIPESKGSYSDRLGKCYELSGRYMMNQADENDVLVHGTITAQFGDIRGKVNNHAWVDKGGEIWEPVGNKIWSKEVYNVIFGPKEIRRYSRDEALKIMLKTGHFGPWD